MNARKELVFRQQKQKMYHDRTSKPLPTLKEGDVVRVQHNGNWARGEVSQVHSAPRSYIVNTEEGSALRRNRRDLIQTKEDPPLGRPPMEDFTAQVSDQGEVEISVPDSAAIIRSSDNHLSAKAISESSGLCSNLKTQSGFTEATRPSGLCSSMKTRSGRTSKLPVRFSDYHLN